MRMRRRRWWRLLLRLADAGQLEVAAVAAAARTALGALAEVQTHALHVRAVRRRAHRPAAHVAPHERNGNLLVRPAVTRRRRTCGSTRTTCRRELRTDAHATMETYYYGHHTWLHTNELPPPRAGQSPRTGAILDNNSLRSASYVS